MNPWFQRGILAGKRQLLCQLPALAFSRQCCVAGGEKCYGVSLAGKNDCGD